MKSDKWHNLSAIQDVSKTLTNPWLALLLGWLDVSQRYRRSAIGPFWLTINMGVLIGALGIVFGTLFRVPLSEFLPFICLGLIIWNYCTQVITEGCLSFINNSETILQISLPFFTYIVRVWWRNTIILFHNLIIFPISLLMYAKHFDWYASLAIFGFILMFINLLWIVLILAVICTRYRDLMQIVQNIMQVCQYITPIMWMPRSMPDGVPQFLLNINPFYHLVSIIREPLLGHQVFMLNWIISIMMAVFGWCIAIFILGRYRNRIAYWL